MSLTSKKCPHCGSPKIHLRRSVSFYDPAQEWMCEDCKLWWQEANGKLASELEFTGRREALK